MQSTLYTWAKGVNPKRVNDSVASLELTLKFAVTFLIFRARRKLDALFNKELATSEKFLDDSI